jgi:hypothetical protein
LLTLRRLHRDVQKTRRKQHNTTPSVSYFSNENFLSLTFYRLLFFCVCVFVLSCVSTVIGRYCSLHCHPWRRSPCYLGWILGR